jgi:hypothetical protein
LARLQYYLLPAMLAAFAGGLRAQQPQATVRVEVTADAKPVTDAAVKINDHSIRTGKQGVAIASVSKGPLQISVVKYGYFPAATTILAFAAQEYVVRMDLQPRKEVEESIKVFATRNDVRVQDSPLHVEVLQREEIEEKMLMTPGDITMMLNKMGGIAPHWAQQTRPCFSRRPFPPSGVPPYLEAGTGKRGGIGTATDGQTSRVKPAVSCGPDSTGITKTDGPRC